MRPSFFALLFAAVLFASCKNSGRNTAAETTITASPAPPPAPESSLGREATGELMNMISAYYSLKDALVITDGTKADEAASKLMSAAELFNNDLAGKPQYNELHPQLQTVMSKSDSIIAAKGDGIEQKRTHFADVSDAMYKIATIAKLQHAGIYHQYCPMALNDKGAYWLSAESEIKNPYYGKKMLECGEVKDSL